MNTIVGIFTAVATILGVAWGIYSKYYSRSARIRRMNQQLRELENEIAVALKENDRTRVNALMLQRGLLVARIRDLRE